MAPGEDLCVKLWIIVAKCVRMRGFAFHSGKLVRFFQNDSEKGKFLELKSKTFPVGGHGPEFRGARCFGNLSPFIAYIRTRLTYINKQQADFHDQNTLVCGPPYNF